MTYSLSASQSRIIAVGKNETFPKMTQIVALRVLRDDDSHLQDIDETITATYRKGISKQVMK